MEMNDYTFKAVLTRLREDMTAEMETKCTSMKLLDILKGTVCDERLSVAQKLYILSEIENWSKSAQINLLQDKG